MRWLMAGIASVVLLGGAALSFWVGGPARATGGEVLARAAAPHAPDPPPSALRHRRAGAAPPLSLVAAGSHPSPQTAPRYVVVPMCSPATAHWLRYGRGPWRRLCPAPGDRTAFFAPGTVVELQTDGQAVPLVHENPAVRAYICRLARLPAGFDGC